MTTVKFPEQNSKVMRLNPNLFPISYGLPHRTRERHHFPQGTYGLNKQRLD